MIQKFTEEELAAMQDTARTYNEKCKEQYQEAVKQLPPELKEIADASWAQRQQLQFTLLADIKEGLQNGTYKKPSDFICAKAELLFGGCIPEAFREYVLYAADNCHRWSYNQRSVYRRSFHTADTEVIAEQTILLLEQYSAVTPLPVRVMDMLLDRMTKEQVAYRNYYHISWNDDYGVAYEIDSGNTECIELMKDVLNGTSDVELNYAIIRGVLKSSNAELHALLGKLLLAARLEEGLRQAICENADCGTIEGFLTIVKVIVENNLIRYSSVKRAVGCWMGLFPDPYTIRAEDLERIPGKIMEHAAGCLQDVAVREEFLQTEDPMKIYTALWAYGVYEVRIIGEKIAMLSESDNEQQILAAGYAAENIGNGGISGRIAKDVIRKNSGNHRMVAMYMPSLMISARYAISTAIPVLRKEGYHKILDYSKRGYCDIDACYSSAEEAEEFYKILMDIYNSISGKSETFSPCVFPWHTAELSKSDLIVRLAYTASALQDNDKIDEIAAHIPEISADYGSVRADVLDLLLGCPETPVQKAMLVRCLADKESYTRMHAFHALEHLSLETTYFRQIEDMLKYKNAEVRKNAITLMLRQEGQELYDALSRMLSDKSEEKRTAALDIILQLKSDECRTVLFMMCIMLVHTIESPTTKERILIEEILKGNDGESDCRDALYTADASYTPVIRAEFVDEAKQVFERYFPQETMTADGQQDFAVVMEKLGALIEEHADYEFVHLNGETVVLSNCRYSFRERCENGSDIPLRDVWHTFYKKEIGSPELLFRTYFALISEGDFCEYDANCSRIVRTLIGDAYTHGRLFKDFFLIEEILIHLMDAYVSAEDREFLASYTAYMLLSFEPEQKLFIGKNYQFRCLLSGFHRADRDTAHFRDTFPIRFLLEPRISYKQNQKEDSGWYHYQRLFHLRKALDISILDVREYLLAVYLGVFTEEFMYKCFFASIDAPEKESKLSLRGVLNTVTTVVMGVHDRTSPVSMRRSFYQEGILRKVREFFGDGEMTESDCDFMAFIEKVYAVLIKEVLSVELRRGDSETKYSGVIPGICRIYGAETYVAILAALGKEPLERSSYYYGDSTKRGCLSHLLSVCVPTEADNAAVLKEYISGTDITEARLIEAAMYAPEWLDITEQYLKWEGLRPACYYFMAHMNESFDDKRKAIIAKYTPLSPEELQSGAFDITWFRTAYETLGEKRFDLVYKAAKYSSDGAKHSRARKYVDAVLGRLDKESTKAHIIEKRSKDLLMAYALIPLEDESDLLARYLDIEEFVKSSRKFGSQRQASERTAADMARKNLALNAGFADVMRLTLKMEGRLLEENRALLQDKQIEEITVRLSIGEDGKAEIVCTKNGKTLKSIPAKYKKNEYIVQLSEMKKRLADQHRRTIQMFEQAMEEETSFFAEELGSLLENPVTKGIVSAILFEKDGKFGFLQKDDAAWKLVSASGEATVLHDADEVRAAHPQRLYAAGVWRMYQKLLFERKLVQPFKQVFRELYVKTAEEMEQRHSLRYAGNQIQPRKTAAVLKSRRWIADVYDGLQKVYYKENIIARIYAQADWFTPSDIEAPTLEWVEFSDRKTGEPLSIKEIPEILFSEVMRDVDMAVSVAHAGGVDPETSHSTMEMRAALLEFALPLFRLENVELKGTHAHITGKRADYTVHLGSGVVHQKGGTMLHILPVHSSHRGKLFLPFADDDPKTAEIMSKVIYLAQDEKIKDPTILTQLNS